MWARGEAGHIRAPVQLTCDRVCSASGVSLEPPPSLDTNCARLAGSDSRMMLVTTQRQGLHS